MVDELQLKHSFQTIKNVLQNKLFPLVERIQSSLIELYNLFLNKNVRVYSSNYSTPITFTNDLKNFKLTSAKAYLNDIIFVFDFIDFKRNGTNAFGLSVELIVKFENFRYYFAVRNKTLFSKFYHQELHEIELEEIADALAQVVVEEIESKISKMIE